MKYRYNKKNQQRGNDNLTKNKVFLKIQIWFQNFTLQEAFVLHRNFTTLKKHARMSDYI